MENQSPEIQMETLSIVIDSINASSSYYEGTELAHGEESDDNEAHEEKANEISEIAKLAQGKEPVVEEAHEEDDYMDPTWMISIEKKLVAQPKIIKVSSSTSIHRVPHTLFRQDESAYVPQVVSIGPLHYHKRRGKLKAMEEHKWRILNEIVCRKDKDWLKNCMVAVKKKEEEARECYSQVIHLNSISFVEMMVLDGCFLIELFRKKLFEDDPIFQLPWLESELTIDLVMLENQIPFFVLQTLFDLMDIPNSSLKGAAFKFFCEWPRYKCILPKIERTHSSNHPIHHLLHLLHENIVLSTGKKYPEADCWVSIQCASKLQESGIKFRTGYGINVAGNFLDINFEEGIIEIPHILITDKTNTILRNLVAFEQCYFQCKKYITTYTYFMDWLINNSKDVEILLQKGIIENKLGTDEDVALLFNNINKQAIIFPCGFYLKGVCEEINYYCRTAWPKLRATLVHDYFKNPWAVISFVAAVFLLLLTTMQAFFSGFPKFAVGS